MIRGSITNFAEDEILEGKLPGNVNYGIQGPTGPKGPEGGYYIPAVTQMDENTIQFTFEPSNPDIPVVDPATAELPALEADWNAGEGNPGHILNRPFYESDGTVKKIDKKFLPDDVGGVNLTGAVPGQTLLVKSVDENGKPTAWEAVDPVTGADWNAGEGEPGYILNKPFGEGKTVLAETIIDVDRTVELDTYIPLNVNKKYIVTVNGTDYSNVSVSDYNEKVSLFVYSDTNETILWVNSYEDQLKTDVTVLASDVVGSLGDKCTISIRGNELVKIDPKFLPEDHIIELIQEHAPENGFSVNADWNAGEGNPGHILNRPFYESDGTVKKIDKKFLPDDVGGVNLTGAVPGQTLLVKSVDENGKPTAWEAVDPITGADWNAAEGEPGHILNRTHWTESNNAELPVSGLWSEGTIDEVPMFYVTAPLGLELGKTYIVNWGGVEYSVVGRDLRTVLNGSFGAGVFIGNQFWASGEDNTGEPFVVAALDDPEAADGLHGVVIPQHGQNNTEFHIYGDVEIVHKLDNKYLDVDWLPGIEKKDILPVQTVETTTTTDQRYYFVRVPYNGADFLGTEISVGTKITVEVNGHSYECVVSGDAMDGFLASAGTVNLAFYSNFIIVWTIGSQTLTLRVYIPDHNKMPVEYLPVGGADLGGVKNGGNVVINEDGTMTAPNSGGTADLTDEEYATLMAKLEEE